MRAPRLTSAGLLLIVAGCASAPPDDSLTEPYPESLCPSCAAWNAPHGAFRIFGNSYYVGTDGLASVLITSLEGHVLIDGGLPSSAPLIRENIRALGFDVDDVVLILNSHAHFDHAVADARARLNLRRELIPPGAANRPATALRPRWITIHNTANRSPDADAAAHSRYLLSDDAREREVSWHYTVDDGEVVQHVPTDEVAWHAGPRANAASIGIEICEHVGIDQAAADDRAALLTALLLVELDIPLAHVRTHHSWTGKQCPRILLQTPGGWERFLARVTDHCATL